jgi:phosphoribosylformylglycinamidine synthase
MSVFRCFTEKREGYDCEAHAVLGDLRDFLGIRGLESVRLLCRYDVEGISESVYKAARETVFSEPQTDVIFDESPPHFEDNSRTLVIEALPGQYDQRADSCVLCIQLLLQGKQGDGSYASLIELQKAEEPSPCFTSSCFIPLVSGISPSMRQ